MSIRQIFKRLFEWLGWRHQNASEPTPPTPAPGVEQVTTQPVTAGIKKRTRAKTQELAVNKIKKAHLLDYLDDYFAAAVRFRDAAPDDYQFFARTGCVVTDVYFDRATIKITNHAPIFAGGIFIPRLDGIRSPSDEQFSTPSFVYFSRMKKPRVWPSGPMPHLLYRVTLIYRAAEGVSEWDFPVEMLVARDKAGKFTVLGEPRVSWQNLPPSEHGPRHLRGPKKIAHVTFGLPGWLVENWNRQRERPEYHGKTIHDYACNLFAFAYETYRECVTELLVSAQKNGTRAIFALNLRDARRMFSDREMKAAATPGGRLRPIFHYVREHGRTIESEGEEKTVTVREHYRGLRDFFWKGYAVTISWPNRANKLINESSVDVMSHYAEDVPLSDTDKWYSTRQAAKKVAEAVFQYDERKRG